jgi:hypothetical protein
MEMRNKNGELTEEYIQSCVVEYLHKKIRANWKHDKTRITPLHHHGEDLCFVGGTKNGERLFVECKKEYKRNGRETWLDAIGQIVTRIRVSSCNGMKGRNTFYVPASYNYALGLHKVMAQKAIERIPKAAAQIIRLRIFSVDDDGFVKEWTSSKFGKKYPLSDFSRPETIALAEDTATAFVAEENNPIE